MAPLTNLKEDLCLGTLRRCSNLLERPSLFTGAKSVVEEKRTPGEAIRKGPGVEISRTLWKADMFKPWKRPGMLLNLSMGLNGLMCANDSRYLAMVYLPTRQLSKRASERPGKRPERGVIPLNENRVRP